MEVKRAPNICRKNKFLIHNILYIRKKNCGKKAPQKQANLNASSDIYFPQIDPLDYINLHNSPQAAETIVNDKAMSPAQRAYALQLVNNAAKEKGGLFSTGDLVRAGVGAGLGYGAASLTGKTLGLVFGMSGPAQKTLARAGALGGLLRATGVWK